MFFVIKSILAAVVLIAIMQIEIGGKTLESKAENFMRTSQATIQLRHVANGAIKLTQDTWKKAMGWAHKSTEATNTRKTWNVEFKRKVVDSTSDSE